MWWQTYLNVLVNLCFETCFWSKIDMFHISCIICLLFVIVPGLESCPFFVLVFISNFYFLFFFESVTFTRITRRAEQELPFKVIAPAPTYLLWKMWIQVLRILDFGVYFSPEAVSQSLSKNNPTENKSMPKFRWQGNMHKLENVQRIKCFRGYRNKLQN